MVLQATNHAVSDVQKKIQNNFKNIHNPHNPHFKQQAAENLNSCAHWNRGWLYIVEIVASDATRLESIEIIQCNCSCSQSDLFMNFTASDQVENSMLLNSFLELTCILFDILIKTFPNFYTKL